LFCFICSCFIWFFIGFVVFGIYSCYFRFQEHLEAFWTSMSYNLITVEGWLEGAMPRVNMGALREAKMKKCARKQTRPTTRSSCRSSSTTRSTTRPGCGPSHQNQAQLGPQLDRVVARVRITETNSVHNSTELWPESVPGNGSWMTCFFLCLLVVGSTL